MKRAFLAVWLMLVAGCWPYPRQLGLITPPFEDLAARAADRVPGTDLLYRTKDDSGALYQSVLCYAPPQFDVVQGPTGSFVWTRTAMSGFEIEFLLRPSLTSQQLKDLRQAIPANVPPPVLLVPCGIEATSLSPLAQLPVGAAVSFTYGKGQDNTDLLTVRVTAAHDQKSSLLRMIQSNVGVILRIKYRVSGTQDANEANGYLRSGT